MAQPNSRPRQDKASASVKRGAAAAVPAPDRKKAGRAGGDRDAGASTARPAGKNALKPHVPSKPPGKPQTKSSAKARSPSPADFAEAGEVARLRAENAALSAELDSARRRIAELETLREQSINRIDWVIDSLQTLRTDGEEG